MIVLGIESATELVGVAVGDGDGPRAGAWVTGRRRHGETLAPAVVHVLEQAGLGLGDLGALAVDLGPGLFTGLRVGVATAKGLAQGLGIGVVGVTSLEVLAVGALDTGWPGPVAAVVDAKRGEVFVARYRRGPTGPLEVAPPARRTPAELAADLDREDGLLAVGDGALRYAEVIAGGTSVTVAGASLAAPRPEVLVEVALRRLEAGAVPAPAAGVRPLYLREADVRINWARRAGPSAG